MASQRNPYQSTWWQYQNTAIRRLIDTTPLLINQDVDLEPGLELPHNSQEQYVVDPVNIYHNHFITTSLLVLHYTLLVAN
jgi:hypothetical protein